jgi:hypothetical protein
VRKGGEQRVWCGEAETGAHFIGVERRWWGVETVGQAAAGAALSRHRLLEGETTGSDDSWGNRRGVSGASVQLHKGVEGRPSAAGGVAAPAEGDGLAFDRRRKTTRVIHSWAECTGPKGRWGRFRWETKKMEAGRMREWAENKE